MEAGDAVICHYLLAHSIVPNCSPDLRYAVYFRLNVREGERFHPEPMTNMWIGEKEEALMCVCESEVQVECQRMSVCEME